MMFNDFGPLQAGIFEDLWMFRGQKTHSECIYKRDFRIKLCLNLPKMSACGGQKTRVEVF